MACKWVVLALARWMLARISSASLVQRSRTQIARFGVLSNCHLGNQIAEHIGGSRATAATSDRHAARLVFQGMSEPSA